MAEQSDTPPKIPSQVPPIPGNSKAEKESIHFESEDLERASKKKDHHRKEGLKDAVAFALSIFIKLFLVGFVIAGGIVFWHLTTSAPHHWLSTHQLDKLESILGSALIAVLFSRAVERYM